MGYKIPGVNKHIFKQPDLPWGSFSSDAAAAFNNYETLGDGLTAEEKIAMAAYIDAEVANGNHAKKDYEVIFSLSGTNALVDYIGGKVATAVNAPTQSINGYAFDGATNYINTNWNPTDDGVNYLQDDAQAEVFLESFGTPNVNNAALFGVAQTSLPIIEILDNTNPALFRFNGINSADSANINNPTKSQGLKTLLRSNSTNAHYYEDGVEVYDMNVDSSGINTIDVFIGCRNLNGSPANYKDETCSQFMVGAVLVDQSGHNTNLRALLTGLGVSL